eukprot:CAMPEP_0184673696 /NCGR_PEP_ID=MMETSP0308-20130426/86824_1 /TAXON_ID=38269 /ORGANISM="Gloeochaete witrockiana, Strain SAG 46.84" /LENGTH=348 /DNA_ID=CAMNT_0027121211 /DNA_START=304 /DNA_END=1350 /DNA_ORIENTATION=+
MTNDMNVLYYSQRAAKGTLLICEGVSPSPTGYGYYREPGLYTQEQAVGWKKISDVVHAKGGYIYCQVFHAGRVSHSSLLHGDLNGVKIPLAPSAIAKSGVCHTPSGKVPFEVPHALTVDEIKAVIKEHVACAKLAVEVAGFDGIEFHSANGYLLHEFLSAQTNHRTDAYGGSVSNRCRLLLEVVDAVSAAIGSNRVAIKFSPGMTFSDLTDEPEDIKAVYPYLLAELNKRNLAFVEVADFMRMVNGTGNPGVDIFNMFHNDYKGTLCLNANISPDQAEQFLSEKKAALISFGSYFMPNPDFAYRIRNGLELTPKEKVGMNLWQSGGLKPDELHVGYTDQTAYDGSIPK